MNITSSVHVIVFFQIIISICQLSDRMVFHIQTNIIGYSRTTMATCSMCSSGRMYLIYFFAFLTIAIADDQPTITLPNGKIAGLYTNTIRYRVPFYAYLGIPYAEPPIGNLRFQPPQPVQNWNGTFQATSNTKICHQSQKTIREPQTEDCLYLSVYTPIAPSVTALLPVMVSIYGGGFTHGYASFGTVGPDYLLEKDIIVVSFNYRVGPFGFLSTGDEVIPGNMGLKDQLLALKWVKENIQYFGGDPDKVTIKGQSAGAASVTYHILSPSSAGLFRAAIASSGTALCNWASQRPDGRIKAYRLAKEIDPSINRYNTTRDILNLLLTADADRISQTGTTFLPVVEVEHEGAFISEPMYDTVKNGRINKVPLLIGFNSEEELAKAKDIDGLKRSAESYDTHPEYLVNADMNISDPQTILEVAMKAKPMYTDSTFIDDLGAVVKFTSDDQFVRGILRYAQLQAQFTDVFVYEFTYHGILGMNNFTFDGCGRVMHGEEGKYLWAGTDLTKVPESDVMTLDRFVGYHTNFIKSLDPNGEDPIFSNLTWPKVNGTNYWYMEIDKDLTVKENPRDSSYRGWVSLYDAYAVEPLVAY